MLVTPGRPFGQISLSYGTKAPKDPLGVRAETRSLVDHIDRSLIRDRDIIQVEYRVWHKGVSQLILKL